MKLAAPLADDPASPLDSSASTSNPTVSGAGPSDSALVCAARAGETWAAEALFRRHAPRANRMAFRLLGSRDELDDVVQESFTRALARIHALQAPDRFAAWLIGIVVRVTKKHLYRRSVRRRLGLVTHEVHFDELISSAAPPDAALRLRRLYATLQRMPTPVRIALTLRRIEGLSIQEITEATGASASTVKRRIRAGTELLDSEENSDDAR